MADSIKFDYSLEGYGWAYLNFELNELKLSYRASDIGSNPLEEILRIAVKILNGPVEELEQMKFNFLVENDIFDVADTDDPVILEKVKNINISPDKFNHYKFSFNQEGSIVEVRFIVQAIQNRMVKMEIIEYDDITERDDYKDVPREVAFSGVIDFYEFIKQTLSSATKILREYGFIRYINNGEWRAFPIEDYLKTLDFFEEESNRLNNRDSNIYDEINLIMKHIGRQI
jgi:hypothetical protein